MTRLTDIDRDALERALATTCRDPVERMRIDRKLADGGSWYGIASAAAYRLQFKNLELQPWESPSMFGDVDRPTRHQHAFDMLRKLLSLGLSRFEPDPLGALERER